jgi:hypothetical protein
MRRQILYLSLVALALLTVGASGTLAASNTGGKTLFVFNGRLLADAGSSPSIFVDVNGGNRIALKKLIGHGDNQQFAVDANTQYLRWTHGVPSVVPESNLVAGDRVSVKIRAERVASLAQIESMPAKVVSDTGPPNGRYAHRPLWLFIGTLNAPASGGHFTLHITNGNLRSLRAMLGQPLNQTFAYDSHTIFVLWHGRVPTPISPSQLGVGDRISVRIRAPRSFALGQVEQVPANHVGDHQPAS